MLGVRGLGEIISKLIKGNAHRYYCAVVPDLFRYAEREFRNAAQPAEEIAKGAKMVISQGGLEGVDFIFGIYIATMVPVGAVCLCEGASSALADIFTIKVTEKAAHGAIPDKIRQK